MKSEIKQGLWGLSPSFKQGLRQSLRQSFPTLSEADLDAMAGDVLYHQRKVPLSASREKDRNCALQALIGVVVLPQSLSELVGA